MFKTHFKIKLKKDEYRALTGMLLNCDVRGIENDDVREMLILIMASVVRRMVTKLESGSEMVSLKLKKGEAAALRYVLNYLNVDGYLLMVRNDLIYKLHIYFDNNQ